MAAAGVAATAVVFGKEPEAMREVLEESLKSKKGLMLYVKGQAIPGVVMKISAEVVELRSQEYSRIVARLDSIDAVALS
jgi:hypothetical protein